MPTMRAWQFRAVKGGLENNLYLPATGVPKPHVRDDQILVEVYSAGLNPADYKVPELGLIAKAMVPSPSTPGIDFCGKVTVVGKRIHSYHVGEMVFGAALGPLGHGTLGQYILVTKEQLTPMPKGIEVDDAAGMGTVGLTAYQTIQPYVKEGDKVFINGGSGGTGIAGIQIAKALGCHVTASCSTANVELCKSIGADSVIDYNAQPLIPTLKDLGQIFNLVVDNVGSPSNLYPSSHHILVHHGRYMQVGTGTDFYAFKQIAGHLLLPRVFGGGRRAYHLVTVKPDAEALAQVARWMEQGKVRAVLDSVWEYEDAPRAFAKLKTGRAKGKVIVRVRNEQLGQWANY